MSEIRVCFLGTPEFAAVSLQRLLSDEHYKIVGVVSQPDRPAGRKLQLTPSPVKKLAFENKIPTITPQNLRKDPAAFEMIRSWKAEVAVVVAFGQILDQDFLNLFPFGCVNVHSSLLPRWRGAAPIQRALEAGDNQTGVCLQKVVLKLDAGDIIGKRILDLDGEINSLELHDKLAVLGGDLLHVDLMDYIRGNLAALPQDESQVTYAKKIDKIESEIKLNDSARLIHNKVRAFTWGPGTFTLFEGKRLKVHKTRIFDETSTGIPGKIIEIKKESFLVQTGVGVLEVLEVQPESKSNMSAKDFIKGFKIEKGVQLG